MNNERFFCEHCGRWSTRCGKCGNNACNGGSGKLKDGSPCDQCESAYQEDMRTPQESPPKCEYCGRQDRVFENGVLQRCCYAAFAMD